MGQSGELNSYSFEVKSADAERAVRDVTTWLEGRPHTIAVKNVEAYKGFRKLDIDLIWVTSDLVYLVEVKGDTYDTTGNFFFETISNKGKDTPGCFMYTDADYVFYYFVNSGELYILPMPQTRDWFTPRLSRFREHETTTKLRNGESYTTVGRLVPIKVVMANVKGVRKYELPIQEVN